MSPELAEGRVVDARSDLFSMGVVAFECLTGKLPFRGASLPALLSAICFEPIVVPSAVAPVPPGFDEWFARAVARDREQRFQTAKAMVEALEPLLREPPSELDGTKQRVDRGRFRFGRGDVRDARKQSRGHRGGRLAAAR
jgi:serine/threonine protein kinase